MRDADLLAAAIQAATAGNNTAFGRLLGYEDGRRVREWLARGRIDPPLRLLCRLIVAHPESVRRWITETSR